ncbi:MAG: T9SS type A sorting domain-containing protein [Bacteroidia bacterium]
MFIPIQQISYEAGKTTYSFEDKTISEKVYDYRLKAVDVNGNEAYSETVRLSNVRNFFEIYPNPTSGELRIRAAERAQIFEITNQIGQVIQKEQFVPETANLSHLPSGIYFVRISKMLR